VETLKEWKEFVQELKREWRFLWRNRIDDRVSAEGIADRDYPMLFVERGTVIIATRDYTPPNLMEILQQHNPPNVDILVPPTSSMGGWRKFIRSVLSKQERFTRRGRPASSEPSHKKKQQLKKRGRGWLHL